MQSLLSRHVYNNKECLYNAESLRCTHPTSPHTHLHCRNSTSPDIHTHILSLSLCLSLSLSLSPRVSFSVPLSVDVSEVRMREQQPFCCLRKISLARIFVLMQGVWRNALYVSSEMWCVLCMVFGVVSAEKHACKRRVCVYICLYI